MKRRELTKSKASRRKEVKTRTGVNKRKNRKIKSGSVQRSTKFIKLQLDWQRKREKIESIRNEDGGIIINLREINRIIREYY